MFRRLRWSEKLQPAPSRYRNEIAKYIIFRDEEKCTLCGICVETCNKGVHVMKKGYKLFATPESHKCNGSVCEKTDNYCIRKCPQGALKLVKSPMMEVLGRLSLVIRYDSGHLENG